MVLKWKAEHEQFIIETYSHETELLSEDSSFTLGFTLKHVEDLFLLLIFKNIVISMLNESEITVRRLIAKAFYSNFKIYFTALSLTKIGQSEDYTLPDEALYWKTFYLSSFKQYFKTLILSKKLTIKVLPFNMESKLYF